MIDLTIRYKAVVHYTHFLPSLRQVSKIYHVSKSSLQRWSSGLHPKRRRRRPRDVKADVLTCIRSTLESNPMQTIADVQRQVTKSCGIRASIRTVGRAVSNAGYTFKKAFRFVAAPPAPEQLLQFCNALESSPTENVIWIDEAGFYVGDHASRGYSLKGKRLRCAASRTLRRNDRECMGTRPSVSGGSATLEGHLGFHV